jgi:hypothetical protein
VFAVRRGWLALGVLGLLVGLVTGWFIHDLDDSGAAELAPGIPARPLALPHLLPGGGCPVSQSPTAARAASQFDDSFGWGPVRVEILGDFQAGASLTTVLPAASPDGQFPAASTTWGGGKMIWSIVPGPVDTAVVRGRALDGDREVRWGQALQPDPQLLLLAAGSFAVPTAVSLSGARVYPVAARVEAPGCYGLQIDTATSSEVIVFEARVARGTTR